MCQDEAGRIPGMSVDAATTDAELIGRACDAVAGYLQIGNETFEADGATFVRNIDTPRRWDANHVTNVRCSDEASIARLLARADLEYAQYPYRRFDTDPRTPAQFVARLVLEGYEATPELHLVLEGALRATAPVIDIRPIEGEAAWSAYEALYAADIAEMRARQGRADETRDMVVEFMRYKRAKEPAVRYFLAYVDGSAVAYFSSWPGSAGVGVVEDLFTAREYRHRGIATALIARCVADARERGAGPVVIGADPTDTPMRMYAAMGFRPMFVTANYVRHLAA
jgi:GNAT superfamily N-acetyltransferase